MCFSSEVPNGVRFSLRNFPPYSGLVVIGGGEEGLSVIGGVAGRRCGGDEVALTPDNIVSYMSTCTLIHWNLSCRVKRDVVTMVLMSRWVQKDRCIISSSAVLQHGHLSVIVSRYFDFSVHMGLLLSTCVWHVSH